MTEKVLLVEVDGTALPNNVPPTAQTGTWMPAVYVPPAIPVPAAFAAAPLIDGVLLTWNAIALDDALYLVYQAPDNAGVPGTWSQLGTTNDLRYYAAAAAGSAQRWYRIRAEVKGRQSAVTASIKVALSVTTGVNLLPDEFSQFDNAALPAFTNTVSTSLARDTAQKFIGPASVRYVTSSNDAYTYFGPYPTGNIRVTPGRKYVVSFYVRADAAGVPLEAYLFDGATHYSAAFVSGAANTWARYWAVLDLSASAATSLLLRMDVNATGRTVQFDGLMVEYQIGSTTAPSGYTRGTGSGLALLALAAAATAQATADGATYIWRQATPPSFPPAAIGDYWIDTANSNRPYYSATGSSWTDVTDPRIAQGLADAAAAQATANGRIKTWFQEATPTAATIGDFWYRPSVGVLYRWDGAQWLNTADNTNAVANPNVLNGGFEQGLESWTDAWGPGLAGWYGQASGSLTGASSMVKYGGTNGTTGIVNAGRITCSGGQVLVARLAAYASSIPINTTQGVSIGFAFYTAAGSNVHATSYAAPDFFAGYCNGVYKSFNKAVEVPSNLGIAYARVVLSVFGYNGTGAWQFDNVQAFLAEPPAAGTNLLINADLARLNTGWSNVTGNPNLLLGDTYFYPTGAQAAGNYAFPYQDRNVDVAPGELYSASCDFQVYGMTGSGQVYCAIQFLDSGGNPLAGGKNSDHILAPANYVDGQWTRLSVNGALCPASTATVRFIIVAGNGITQCRWKKPKLAREPYASAYSPSIDSTWGARLSTPGSGQNIGDQRNLTQSLVNSYGAVRSTSALTASNTAGNGKISVNGHYAYWGSSSAAYNAVTDAVTGLTPGQRYIVYCDDPGFLGGTKVWSVSSSPTAQMQLGDGKYVAGEVTIPATSGGTGSGGAGGGGAGGGSDWCVDVDMLTPDGQRAGDVREGDRILCWDDNPYVPGQERVAVTSNEAAPLRPSTRIETESGASVVASDCTPMPVRGEPGALLRITEMLGREALVRYADGRLAWEVVVSCRAVGLRTVAFIRVQQRCYFAGERIHASIATHNPNNKP